MDTSSSDTDLLLTRVSGGDLQAADELLKRHRPRLRQLVRLRLDTRLAARIDPSDVVQETFAAAHQRLTEYARTRPIAFYPWLRRIACDRLADLHRHHLLAQRRSVTREVSDMSVSHLANVMPGVNAERVVRSELIDRVREALNELPANAFEVLMARFIERLSIRETAEALGISETAVKSRQLRAIQKLRTRLERPTAENGSSS